MSTFRSYTALRAAVRPIDRSCDRLSARVSELRLAGVGVMGSLNTSAFGPGQPD